MLDHTQVTFLIFENCHNVSYNLCTNLCTNLIWQTVRKYSLLPTSLSVLVIFNLFGNSHSYKVKKCFTRLCCGSLSAFVCLLLGNVCLCLPSYFGWSTWLLLSLLRFLHILEDGMLSEISQKGRQVYELVHMGNLKMWVSEMEWQLCRAEMINRKEKMKTGQWMLVYN